MSKIFNIAPALFSWIIFGLVIFNLDYPDSIGQASLLQLTSFFLPLSLALTFSLKLFLKSIFRPSIISFGIIFLLLLKALNVFNLITVILTITAVILILTSFKPTKVGLTYTSKPSKLRNLLRRKPS